MDKTDEELIADYLGGDEKAFGELTQRHLGGVYSFVLRFIGNPHESEDVAQETFLKAWSNLKKYRKETSKFKTWLMRIARNSAIDYLRKKKHIAFSEFDTDEGENILTETIADTTPLPDETFAKGEDSATLTHALLDLIPPHREILLLYYTNELTFEEIGEALNEPTNTVKSRHRRALQALRKILDSREALHQNKPG
jgi:RNA polymerase sigma-70 factor (ECF subfamily)